MSDLVPFEWDALWSFDGLTDLDQIERATGVAVGPDAWGRAWCSEIALIFVHGEEVAAVFSFPGEEAFA